MHHHYLAEEKRAGFLLLCASLCPFVLMSWYHNPSLSFRTDSFYTTHLTEGKTGPEVIKLFPCSTQLSTKFILLINVKMPTIVGILTFISMINTTSERLKARNFFICRYFSVYEPLKF